MKRLKITLTYQAGACTGPRFAHISSFTRSTQESNVSRPGALWEWPRCAVVQSSVMNLQGSKFQGLPGPCPRDRNHLYR